VCIVVADIEGVCVELLAHQSYELPQVRWQLVYMYMYIDICVCKYIHVCVCGCVGGRDSVCIVVADMEVVCLEERWGARVETQTNVRGEIGGWGRVPFNEPYAPLLSTIYDGA